MKAAVSLPHSRFTYYDSIFRLFLITYNNTATPTIPATGTAASPDTSDVPETVRKKRWSCPAFPDKKYLQFLHKISELEDRG